MNEKQQTPTDTGEAISLTLEEIEQLNKVRKKALSDELYAHVQEVEELKKTLEHAKEKTKILKEERSLRKKYESLLKEHVELLRAEHLRLRDQLDLVKIGQTPKLIQKRAEYDSYKQEAQFTKNLWEDTKTKLEKMPAVKKRTEAVNALLRAEVELKMKRMREEDQRKQDEMLLAINEKRLQVAIVNFAKAWTWRRGKLQELEEVINRNAEFEEQIVILDEEYKILQAEEIEKERLKMLARSQMPPPQIYIKDLFINQSNSHDEDNSDVVSVYSVAVDELLSTHVASAESKEKQISNLQAENMNYDNLLDATARFLSHGNVEENNDDIEQECSSTVGSPSLEKYNRTKKMDKNYKSGLLSIIGNDMCECTSSTVDNVSMSSKVMLSEQNQRENSIESTKNNEAQKDSRIVEDAIRNQISENADNEDNVAVRNKPCIRSVEKVSYDFFSKNMDASSMFSSQFYMPAEDQENTTNDKTENKLQEEEMAYFDNIPPTRNVSPISSDNKMDFYGERCSRHNFSPDMNICDDQTETGKGFRISPTNSSELNFTSMFRGISPPSAMGDMSSNKKQETFSIASPVLHTYSGNDQKLPDKELEKNLYGALKKDKSEKGKSTGFFTFF